VEPLVYQTLVFFVGNIRHRPYVVVVLEFV